VMVGQDWGAGGHNMQPYTGHEARMVTMDD
jgi:hypothetical protein